MPRLLPGDPLPLFVASTATNRRFAVQNAAGRWLVISAYGSSADPATRAMLEALAARRDLFDDAHASFLGLAPASDELGPGRFPSREPGFRAFWDFEGAIARRLGLERPASVVLDRALRVLAVIRLDDPALHAQQIAAIVAQLPRPAASAPALANAPVLTVPYVFEPGFCRKLIDYYVARGGEDSGFMREDESGRTVGVVDHAHKRRRDRLIEDESLREGIRARIVRRLVPEIRRAFAFEPTRIERYIVACYDAGEGGYFRPHRDNTTKGTAHRRFAVTINLNAEEHEGGDLRFPEYDQRAHRAPTGGAVVFSCSLMHEALPVTSGTRYCTLPFLYDDAAAKLRAENAAFLDDPELREIALGVRKDAAE
jgi:predicted 2-oxoglutarate/Fe(II)-dependent dioxygenase YbiX/peroxiredoxin